MTHWTNALQRIAYDEGLAEGKQYDTLADWWQGSQLGDYMLWLLEKIDYNNDQTLRLLACRFVRETPVDSERTAWDLLTDDRSRQAVIVAERYANGEATKEELASSRRAAMGVASEAASEWAARAAWKSASEAASVSAARAAWATRLAWEWVSAWAAAWETETVAGVARAAQSVMIREMIPFAEVQELFDRYITQQEIGI